MSLSMCRVQTIPNLYQTPAAAVARRFAVSACSLGTPLSRIANAKNSEPRKLVAKFELHARDRAAVAREFVRVSLAPPFHACALFQSRDSNTLLRRQRDFFLPVGGVRMALQVIQPLERISVESKESRLVQNLSKASVSLKGVVNRDVKVTASGTTQSTSLSASSNSKSFPFSPRRPLRITNTHG